MATLNWRVQLDKKTWDLGNPRCSSCHACAQLHKPKILSLISPKPNIVGSKTWSGTTLGFWVLGTRIIHHSNRPRLTYPLRHRHELWLSLTCGSNADECYLYWAIWSPRVIAPIPRYQKLPVPSKYLDHLLPGVRVACYETEESAMEMMLANLIEVSTL